MVLIDEWWSSWEIPLWYVKATHLKTWWQWGSEIKWVWVRTQPGPSRLSYKAQTELPPGEMRWNYSLWNTPQTWAGLEPPTHCSVVHPLDHGQITQLVSEGNTYDYISDHKESFIYIRHCMVKHKTKNGKRKFVYPFSFWNSETPNGQYADLLITNTGWSDIMMNNHRV